MKSKTAPSGTLATLIIVLASFATPAFAAGGDEVVEWTDSQTNEDYQAKSDAEGATWKFDPAKVSLNQGASSSGTNYRGARILDGNGDVEVLGDVLPGTYDGDDHERYAFWEGNTLFFGVEDTGSGNSTDAIVEFFWFESSIPRGSDFYVMLVKVKSSPNAWDNWRIVKEENMSLLDQVFLFWQDIQPAQWLSVFMEPGGAHGSLRWDFSVPFETYAWEPYKTMQIQESYGAGFELGTGDDAEAPAEETSALGQATGLISSFSEGGAVLDLTSQLLVQAKGNVNESFKIETQYTVTLYRWMMLVQSGGEDMHYKLAALPADDDQEAIEEDSAYAEYFIVMQAERGTPVHIDNIEIGGQFKRNVPFWFDNFQPISASLGDIWISPPTGVCLPGEIAPAGTCNQTGVCGLVAPKCDGATNQWICPVVAAFESFESTCDGLDNDCDGQTDEYLQESCNNACGWGKSLCVDGIYQACDAPQPQEEVCDGVDNDCNGLIDEGVTQVCESSCGAGIRTCSTGQWGTCNAPTPSAELCDGLDNDCDGQVDEGLVRSCQSACGAGTETCIAGTYQQCTAAQPTPEVCDGFDNDCDGQADEGLKRACDTECGAGYETCVDGSYSQCDAPQPAPEQCGDHLDNDCDGQVDNGCDVSPGAPSTGTPPNDTGAPAAPTSSGNDEASTTGAGAGQSGGGVSFSPPAPGEETPTAAAGGCAATTPGEGPLAPLVLWIAAWMLLRHRRSEAAAA